MPVVQTGPGYTGLRAATPGHLVLDSGILYRNASKSALQAGGTGQVAAAIASATPLGATREGCEFDTGKVTRDVAVDGARFGMMDMVRIDAFKPTLKVNWLEWTAETIQLGLGNYSQVDYTALSKFSLDVSVDATDFITNVLWMGTLAGSSTPVLILMENVMARGNLAFGMKDKSEAILPTTFEAHADPASPYTSPFMVYYPNPGS